MPNMNRVILAGHIGIDPELKYMEGSGNAMLRFRLATSERWKDKRTGEKQERTEWHTVIMWGTRAEALNKHLAKGQAVLIEGKIQNRQWEDKDGNKRTTTEIVAHNLEFCGGRRERAEDAPNHGGTPANYADTVGGRHDRADDHVDFSDDIPF